MTNSFRTIHVMIGSSVLSSSVVSFRDVRANAQGSDDLDHERDITLAIHAAIPDLIRDTIRSNPQNFRADKDGCCMAAEPRLQVKASGCFMALRETVRVELTGEAGLAGKIQTQSPQ